MEQEINLPEEISKEFSLITNEIEKIEEELKKYDALQKKYDDFRKQIFDAMIKHNKSKFISNGGFQFTIVSSSPEKTELIIKFNEEKFKEEKPALYKKYLEHIEKTTKGKASYLRITMPKGDE